MTGRWWPALCLAGLAGGACSNPPPATCAIDAGTFDLGRATPEGGDGPPAGVLAFIVKADPGLDTKVAAYRPQTFTLVLDVGRGVVYAGKSALRARTLDGQTFKLDQDFVVGDGPTDLVAPGSVQTTAWRYENVEVVVTPGHLDGKADVVPLATGDWGGFHSFSAALVGRTDDAPPALTVSSSGAAAVQPFLGLIVSSSEPLVPSSGIRLLGGPAGIDLVPFHPRDPELPEGSFPETDTGAVFAFAKPDVVLPFGKTLTFVSDRVTDFAGHVSADLQSRTFVTPLLPQLVAQDGFESEQVVASNTRVVDATTFPVLAGARSLFISASEELAHACTADLGSLAMVRLAVPAGAKALRFTYRAVSGTSIVTGRAQVAVGSEGGAIARAALDMSLAPAKVDLPDGTKRYLGPPQVFSLALPADATTEVIVDFEDLLAGCGTPRSPSGWLVDDLRVE